MLQKEKTKPNGETESKAPPASNLFFNPPVQSMSHTKDENNQPENDKKPIIQFNKPSPDTCSTTGIKQTVPTTKKTEQSDLTCAVSDRSAEVPSVSDRYIAEVPSTTNVTPAQIQTASNHSSPRLRLRSPIIKSAAISMPSKLSTPVLKANTHPYGSVKKSTPQENLQLQQPKQQQFISKLATPKQKPQSMVKPVTHVSAQKPLEHAVQSVSSCIPAPYTQTPETPADLNSATGTLPEFNGPKRIPINSQSRKKIEETNVSLSPRITRRMSLLKRRSTEQTQAGGKKSKFAVEGNFCFKLLHYKTFLNYPNFIPGFIDYNLLMNF